MTAIPPRPLTVAFRVDASVDIGTGHVMRCLTLADALTAENIRCYFISREHPGNLIDFVRAKGYTVYNLPTCRSKPAGQDVLPNATLPRHAPWLGCSWEVDATDTASVLATLTPDWLIVDHYGIDSKWEKALKRHYGKLLVIDDLADRPHECDLLLDFNYSRTQEDYKSLVPTHCIVLAGPRYTLLRRQFLAKCEASWARRNNKNEIRHILIQMGGMDTSNHTCKVLSALQECHLPLDTRITVVLGAKAPGIDIVRAKAADMKYTTHVFVATEKMAHIMGLADIAVGSGGIALYERLFMGLPSIVRPIAENQIEHLHRMATAGLCQIYRSIPELTDKIQRAFREGIPPPPRVVGYGTGEVVRGLLSETVTLRPPRALDIRRSFAWLQDDELRTSFLMRDKPNRRGHIHYWKKLLCDKDQYVFSVYYGTSHVGNAGVKNISWERREAELWLYIGERTARRKGIGRQILMELERFIRDNLSLTRSVLHVRKENTPALHLYNNAGYKQTKDVPLELKSFNDPNVIRMEKSL